MQVCVSMFIGAIQLETNIFVGTFVLCQWLFSVHHFSLKLSSSYYEASCVYKIRWQHICVGWKCCCKQLLALWAGIFPAYM